MNTLNKIYNSILTEKYSKGRPLIVVDVQPAYKKWCNDTYMSRLKNFISVHRGPIFWFFNGEDVGYMDEKSKLMEWLLTDHEFDENVIDQIQFKEKGYGFFRSLMDSDWDRGQIKKLIRYMIVNRINDSRDIENIPNELSNLTDWLNNDNIYIPDINLAELKSFENAYICGGGEHECLSEIRLLMEALNFKYIILRNLVY